MANIAQAVIQKAGGIIETAGRAILASQFPNDFEVYLCTLELADSKNNTIDFFTFPINPNAITKTEPKRENIRNTAGGVTVLSSPTFVPQEINIRGDFGRTFKLLLSLGGGASSLAGAAYSLSAGKWSLGDVSGKSTNSLKSTSFDPSVKNGYGCTKILQAIISKSNGVDKDGLPFRLYFYNMALGESYLVVVPPAGLSLSQNLQKNMIWEYSLTMTAIAPLESVAGEKKAKTALTKICTAAAIQKGVNDLAASLATLL